MLCRQLRQHELEVTSVNCDGSLLNVVIRDLVVVLSYKGEVDLATLQLFRLFHLVFAALCSFQNMSLVKWQNRKVRLK